MKNKLIFLLLTNFIFFGCNSIKQPREVFQPLDYSSEEIKNTEISRIQELKISQPVKALWRAILLNDENVISECLEFVKTQYDDALSREDYFEAKSYYLSLKNAGWKFDKSEEEKINSLYAKDIPGFSSTNQKNPKNIKDCLNATVTIWVDRGIKIENGAGYADIVLGSGFFIDERGYIVTNHHVIESMVNPKYEGYSRLYIKLLSDPDTKIPAKVIGYDSKLDLALLKVEIKPEIILSLGSSSDLNIGDKISVIGTPLGLEGTLTSGIISATERKLLTLGNVFQIDAAVNSGNSGGPLIDEDLKVQAIVFAGILQYQGLNFAIPVEYLKQILPILYNGNEVIHSWIGAYGHTKRFSNKKIGLEIQYVMPGNSANLLGLKKGDVITKVENTKISSLEDLQLVFMAYQPGTIVKITYLKDGSEETTKIIYLEKRPESPSIEFFKTDLISGSFIPLFGLELTNSSSLSHKEYIVTDVIKGTTADELNFSKNDKIKVHDVIFNDENSIVFAQIFAQRKKKGFLDVTMILSTSYDSPYYF